MIKCPHCNNELNIGRLLGSVKSERKAKASKANGAKRKPTVSSASKAIKPTVSSPVKQDKPTVSSSPNYGNRDYLSAYTS